MKRALCKRCFFVLSASISTSIEDKTLKKIVATFTALIFAVACCPSTHADIVLSNFVTVVQDVDPGTNTIQTGYTPTSGSNSVLFVTFSFDDAGGATDAVTFGGVSLTRVDKNTSKARPNEPLAEPESVETELAET